MPRLAACALAALTTLALTACGNADDDFVACLGDSGGERIEKQEDLAGLRFTEDGAGIAAEELSYASVVAVRGEERRVLVAVGGTGGGDLRTLVREDVSSVDKPVLLPWSKDPTGPLERCEEQVAPGAVTP